MNSRGYKEENVLGLAATASNKQGLKAMNIVDK